MKKEKIIAFPELESEGIKSKKVLDSIRSIPRELFVSDKFKKMSCYDISLPIDCGQTISQPYMVCLYD